jgi:hypothetical protein
MAFAGSEFVGLETRKVYKLLVKPANPLPLVSFVRQINLLRTMNGDLILDHIVAACVMAELEVGPQNSSGPVANLPPTAEIPGSMGHRFLQRYVPFLPYPPWVATLGPVSGTNAKAVSPSQRESPSTASLPSGLPQPQYIPTLEELRQVLAVNEQPRDGRSSSAAPAKPAPIGVDPEAERRAHARFVETDIRSTGLTCRNFERLFIGNIKKDIPLSFLQWLIDAFSLPASDPTQEADDNGATVVFTLETNAQTYPTVNYIYDCSIHRHSSNGTFKGCIHASLATDDEPTMFERLFHRRLLFDTNGVWVATTPIEEELMHAYCNAFGRIKDEAGVKIRELLGNLPRSPMCWEPAGKTNPVIFTRRAVTQTEFVQLLQEGRNPAHIPNNGQGQ